MARLFSITCALIVAVSIVGNARAAGGDTSDPSGRWYLASGSQRLEMNLSADGGWFGTIGLENGTPAPVDEVAWNAETRVLQFRRNGGTDWQWFRGRIVEGVFKGRSTDIRIAPELPAPTMFIRHVTGWNSDAIDTDIAPRVFDAVLNENFLARIRIDRSSADPASFVGHMKVYATASDGALSEELQFDIDITQWNGSSLEFQRSSGAFWQAFNGTVTGRKVDGSFTQAGTPQVFDWSGERAEVLGRGQGVDSDLGDWQQTTRRRLELLKMDGNPAPSAVEVNILQADLPPRPEAQMSPRRDDDPDAWPQSYSSSEVELLIDLPDPHNGGALTRRAHGYLARPDGDAEALRPAALVLNGHGGGAWGMMDPNDLNYWYGDGFARRGYVVLALDVSHRSHGDDPGNGNIAHPAIASPGFSSDWEEEGERIWTAMRAIDFLLEQPGVDPGQLVVAGLSMGGEVASLTAAMDPRVHAVVTSGYSPDFNVMAWNANHPCWEWQHADIREYLDMSDYLALISPRRLLAQSGETDFTFSLREQPFAADKQVVRRTLASFQGITPRFRHHLHDRGHVFRVGALAVDGTPGHGIRATTVQSPPVPWDLGWQIDSQTQTIAPDLFRWVGFGDALFANGFEPD